MTARTFLATTFAALLLGACGDDEEVVPDESIRDFTLEEVMQRPPLDGGEVGVAGTATIVDGAGFILFDEDAAVFVAAGEEERSGVEGERLRVVGTVERLGQEESAELAEALNRDEDPEAEVASVAEARLQTDSGSLIIVADRVMPAPQ